MGHKLLMYVFQTNNTSTSGFAVCISTVVESCKYNASRYRRHKSRTTCSRAVAPNVSTGGLPRGPDSLSLLSLSLF